jgi:dihydroorotate dehydrogenase
LGEHGKILSFFRNYPMSLLSSFNPYALVRSALFQMDPEAAHDLTLGLIARTQNTPLALGYAQAKIDDPVDIAGLKFPNRVGLAAGLDKNARCLDGWQAMGFGFVEVGTVTPLAQPGNPKPRMFRIQERQALINRLGFNNEGLGTFISNLQQAKCRRQPQLAQTKDPAHRPMVLGLNIGKNANTPIEQATDDYLLCLSAVYPHADYITINISSPNTQNLRSLQSDTALEQLLSALAERRHQLQAHFDKTVPLFLKIAPDLDDAKIQVIAQALQRQKQDSPTASWGVIATNTTLSRQAVQGLPHAQETGGLSGAPVLEMSNHVIRQLRQHLGPHFPIIGVGGVLSGADAVSKIQAGADLVQIYTGLIYKGPALIREAALALQQHRLNLG